MDRARRRARALSASPRRAACGRGARAPGFTLVEVAAALVIVGFASVAMIGALGEALRAQRRAEGHLTAMVLADAKLAELAALPDDSLARADSTGGFAPPFARYRWRWAVRRPRDERSIVQARVTVEWPGGSYDLGTLLHREDAALLPLAVEQ